VSWEGVEASGSKGGEFNDTAGTSPPPPPPVDVFMVKYREFVGWLFGMKDDL
jgi:hypothetical protein